VYAFLRISTDEVTLVIINNGYLTMPTPVPLKVDQDAVPPRVVRMIAEELRHWKTGRQLTVQNGAAMVAAKGKTIDIYCRQALRSLRRSIG
jgi:hypothetical protein